MAALSEQNWKNPLRWDRQAHESGRRIRVFCASLADIWDNKVPPEWRVELFELIGETPHLDWLLLTKRPGNIEKMLERATSHLKPWPWPNVWLGATAEDQDHYDRRWKVLRRIPAAVHFISYEPALGPIELSDNARLPDWNHPVRALPGEHSVETRRRRTWHGGRTRIAALNLQVGRKSRPCEKPDRDERHERGKQDHQRRDGRKRGVLIVFGIFEHGDRQRYRLGSCQEERDIHLIERQNEGEHRRQHYPEANVRKRDFEKSTNPIRA